MYELSFCFADIVLLEGILLLQRLLTNFKLRNSSQFHIVVSQLRASYGIIVALVFFFFFRSVVNAVCLKHLLHFNEITRSLRALLQAPETGTTTENLSKALAMMSLLVPRSLRASYLL